MYTDKEITHNEVQTRKEKIKMATIAKSKVNKTAVAKKSDTKVATKPAKTEKKAVEKKPAEKRAPKPKFDAQAYSAEILKAFKDNKYVDVIADTALPKGPRDTTQAEYAYIHFFKKGTQKDMFKMYNMAKGSRFAISRAVYELGKFEATPKKSKNKKGEEVVSYANITVTPDKAIETANKLIETYIGIA